MKTYPPLTAYRVTNADGTSYITSMAAGVTLDEAREYFLGSWTDEDPETGKETKRTVVNVEAVNP